MKKASHFSLLMESLQQIKNMFTNQDIQPTDCFIKNQHIRLSR